VPLNSNRHTQRASRRFRARLALGVVAAVAACNVYDSQLIGTASGPGGTPGVSGTAGSGGSVAGVSGRGGGAGGTAGTPSSGGKAGVGGTTGGLGGGGSPGDGGTVATGGTSGMEGGSDGDGGEDPGVGGSAGAGAGAGGQSGAGGTAGATAGSSGAGAGGASGGGASGAGGAGAGAGGAGAGGMAGTAGMGTTCPGCARLSVPLTATANKAHFTLLLPGATDLSAATITFRVAKLAGTGGTFKGYIQEGSPNYQLQDGVNTTIASIGTGMQNIAWSIASAGTAANKTSIQRIGIEIAGTSGSSWTNPTVLFVDSIVVTGSSLTSGSYTFDTEATVYTTPTEQGPAGRLFLNSYADDTNVTGAAISWLGP
jgi:hypothetical protein